ncbi:MAG: hypothetical protein GY744_15510 [Gammaproteobacteria bacterium]|nr:hypothetical protein [Gammaproteobacteria bacterium]
MTQTSTGTTFAIVAESPATFNAAGYAALTYVEVGEVTDIAEIGSETAKVEHKPLKTGVVEKFKGFTDWGSSSISFAKASSDAGQVLLASGDNGANKNKQHSVCVTLQDGTKLYFVCKVFGFKTAPGSADSIVSCTSNIEIESVIVEV